MVWRYLLCLFVPFVLFASSGAEGTNYDIIERTINFLIFFGILYYLLANRIKDAYNARINGIADKLENVQNVLKKSAQKREDAKKRVQKAKDDAKTLQETSKKELQILVTKMQDELNNELANLEKSHQDRVLMERRRMKREIVSEVLSEMFEGDTLALDRKEFVNIILKKVA